MSVVLGSQAPLGTSIASYGAPPQPYAMPTYQQPQSYAAPVYGAPSVASYVPSVGVAPYAAPGTVAVVGAAPQAVASYVPPPSVAACGVGSYVPQVVRPACASGQPSVAYGAVPGSVAMLPSPGTAAGVPSRSPATASYAPVQSGAQSARGMPTSESLEEAPSFTRGFPDPASIAEQKEAYSRSLDLQLNHGNQSLQAQNAERKKQLHEAAEKRKQQLILQVEQQMKAQEMALDEQTNQAMMGLKKAALDQRAALEQQAAALTLEYQQRKMQEEFVATQAEMQRQYMESHGQLQAEVQKHYSESQAKLQGVMQPPQVAVPTLAAAPMVPAQAASYSVLPPANGMVPSASHMMPANYAPPGMVPVNGARPPPQPMRQG